MTCPYFAFSWFSSSSSPVQSPAAPTVGKCRESTRATLALGHRNRKFGLNDLPHYKEKKTKNRTNSLRSITKRCLWDATAKDNGTLGVHEDRHPVLGTTTSHCLQYFSFNVSFGIPSTSTFNSSTFTLQQSHALLPFLLRH